MITHKFLTIILYYSCLLSSIFNTGLLTCLLFPFNQVLYYTKKAFNQFNTEKDKRRKEENAYIKDKILSKTPPNVRLIHKINKAFKYIADEQKAFLATKATKTERDLIVKNKKAAEELEKLHNPQPLIIKKKRIARQKELELAKLEEHKDADETKTK